MRIAAMLLLGSLLFCAGWLLLASPQGYADQDRARVASTADPAHVAGTDELGRDRAVRVSLALLLGFMGACAASALASALALSLGSLSAFGPGWSGRALLYAGDLFLTLPWLFLLMLIRAALPLNLPPVRSEIVTYLLLALFGIPAFLRTNHERTATLLRAEWLLQARAAGLTRLQIFRQLWPHLRPLLWTQFLLYVPACLIAEANLGTLGLGLSEPLPSLGNFLANLQSAALVDSSRLIYLPIVVLVLALVALEFTVFGVES